MSAAPVIDEYLAAFGRGQPRFKAPQAEVASAVRRYLADARAYLEARHQAGDDPQAINAANSDLIDRLVRSLFHLAEATHYAEGGSLEQHLAAVAVGGYARREMSIHSDVDLLLLYDEPLTDYIRSVAQSVQYRLWDAGNLTVGCATRTVDETLRLAAADGTVRTAILDARFVVGDVEIFHEFRDALRDRLFSDRASFIAERVSALRERHRKYGESLYLLQPNVKEGAGALRDYHTAYWVARAAYPGLRGLDDLLHLGLLNEREMDELRDALRFVWRVRNELHLTSRRRNDQMSFELQERLADVFGYATRGGAELPVEAFMGDYYRHARAISSYSEIVIEQCQRRVAPPQPRPEVHEVEEGFRVAGGQLEVPHAAHLRERPVRLLLAFAVAQDHEVPLSRTALRFVRGGLGLIDDAFRRSPEAAACFERILGSEHRVMRTLMAMNEVGLLGAYLPEWEHIVCRWQHVLYHTYTVDVHSIFLVEELRRLLKGKYEDELPDLSELVRSVEDRVVLYLSCLLHDVGKGLGGDHSNKGMLLAARCLARLGIEPERARRVEFLVHRHLLMSHLAQRRDLSDPRLILEFAQEVGDRTNLRNLYLLTFADIRASSADAWSKWKRMLLADLYQRAAEVLETGAEDASQALGQIEAEIRTRRLRARERLLRDGYDLIEVDGYLDTLPQRYFIAHTPRQIVRHAELALGFDPARVVASAIEPGDAGASELLLVTRDRSGLFATSAGVLTSAGVNILGANAYTTREGLALEIFRVETPEGDEAERQKRFEEVQRTLHRVLARETDVRELLRRRRRPVFAKRPPARRPPKVEVTNEESDFYTIVDVSADDRLGLLYDLTRVIAGHGLEVYISKAATILDQVADTFYLKDRRGRKLVDPAALEKLRADLLDAAAGESADD